MVEDEEDGEKMTQFFFSNFFPLSLKCQICHFRRAWAGNWPTPKPLVVSDDDFPRANFFSLFPKIVEICGFIQEILIWGY